MNELNLSNVISGNRVVQTYNRNGSEIGTNGIREYVCFTKLNPPLSQPINVKYLQSDLLILTVITQNSGQYTVTVTDINSMVMFQRQYTDVLNDIGVLLPRGNVFSILPLSNVGNTVANIGNITIVAEQVSIIQAISL